MAYIKLNDPEVFNEFWEKMAASVKLIGHTNEEKHYHSMDNGDIAEAIKTLHSPALISFYYKSKPFDGKSHFQKKVVCWIMVLAKQDISNDSGRRTALALTEKITDKIIARLRKYKDDLELPGFDFNSVSNLPHYNVDPLWHGWVMEIPILISATQDFTYKEEDFN